MAGHLRDFVDPQVDTFQEVLSAGEGPLGSQLHTAGRMALRVMGARLLSSTDSAELWRFPFGKDQQAVMRMHQPEVVIPALLRHHDLGVFYARTGWPSESGHDAGPLWEPEIDQTSVLRGIDTGDAESDATVSMVAALAQRSRHLRTAGRFGAWAIGPYRDKKAVEKWRADTERTKAEIAAHYDIKSDVYTGATGFLDHEWVQYSSGLLAPHIRPEEATLEDLQAEKVASLIRKLELNDAESVLEVGGGWGGLAVAIAKAAPHISITSLTISHEQFEVAKRRAEEAGVADRVTFLEQDYRKYQPKERFDRIVSVEMIEAVDWRDLDTYFDKLAEFIDPDRGVIALQAITVPHHKEPSQHHRDSFANVAIFPGGYLSSVRKIRQHMERRGFGLAEKPTEMGPSYALTLHEWLKNLSAHRPALSEKWQAEGHTPEEIDRFYRGFGFYLAACVAGFRSETGPNMGGQQLVFKPAA